MNNHHPNRALPVEELQARRLKAGRLFARGKTAYYVEKKFGVSSTTAREWRERWNNGTISAQKQGRISKLTDAQKKRLYFGIQKGPEAAGYKTQLWTLELIPPFFVKQSIYSTGQDLFGTLCMSLDSHAKSRPEEQKNEMKKQSRSGGKRLGQSC